jgi:hypothetical protein
MKSQEIMEYVVRGDMPDTEQVRANCHRQYASTLKIVRRFRLSTAIAVAALCILASGVVYAIGSFVSQQIDTGGSQSFVTVPEDYFQSTGTNIMLALYISDVPVDVQPHFDEKTAQILRGFLEGKVFTEDGMPFDLLSPIPGLFSRGYRADDKGNVLYDAGGYEIGTIYYSATVNSEPHGVSIMSPDELQRQLGYNSTQEEAVALLGRDFRLPTVYIDALEPPRFQLTDKSQWLLVAADSETQELLPYESNQVRVRYDGDAGGIQLIIENERTNEHSATEPWHIPGGVIEEYEIAGVKINMITSSVSDSYTHYAWTHDSLVYIMTYPAYLPGSLTETQAEEIIRSMIE